MLTWKNWTKFIHGDSKLIIFPSYVSELTITKVETGSNIKNGNKPCSHVAGLVMELEAVLVEFVSFEIQILGSSYL